MITTAMLMADLVAPFVGAWIEIVMKEYWEHRQVASLRSSERGLK